MIGGKNNISGALEFNGRIPNNLDDNIMLSGLIQVVSNSYHDVTDFWVVLDVILQCTVKKLSIIFITAGQVALTMISP